MVKAISKSQANLFLQCPYKWKKCYIDKIRSAASPQMLRGTAIHKKIEKFYSNYKADDDLKNFMRFENERLEELKKLGKTDPKYCKPLFQELSLTNEELGLKGICDAVYINPKDDGVIIIDWKTGKYYPENFDDYRFELAVYAELVKHSGMVDDVKYIGIYFVDADKLFFEELKQETIDKMYKTIEEVRTGIASGEYPPKKNKWCWFCQFKKTCPLMRYGA